MLDELTKTIECLKSRIKEHKDQIQIYESRTRTTLIDPLLRSLGWDVSDPSVVTIEPKTDGGWADYALLDKDGKTVAFVEAKKLSDREPPIKQAVGYAVSENIQNMVKVRYCASTNGDTWELYDVFDGKTVLKTSIMSDATAKCALQLLGLWRKSMADGLHSEAVRPVASIQPPPPPVPPTPPLPRPGWTALNGSLETTGKPAPKLIRFPDGSETVTDSWLVISLQVASWLHKTGHLTRANCQILTWETANAKADRYILSRDGKHPDSTEFGRPRRIGDGIILNYVGSPIEAISRSIRMLEQCSQDPSRVLLQLS